MDYPKTQANVNLLAGKFTDGNPLTGTPQSRDPASWANDVTDSVLNVQVDGGFAPAEGDPTQLQKALRRRYGGALNTIAATQALTDDMAGLVLINAAAGNVTVTLPFAVDGPWPFDFVRIDASGNTVTVAAAAGDTIAGAATVKLSSQYSGCSLKSDGANTWQAPAGLLAGSVRVFTNAGNPNGAVAGRAGTVGGLPADLCEDTTHSTLYVCTVTGAIGVAVWAPAVPAPTATLTGSAAIALPGAAAAAGTVASSGTISFGGVIKNWAYIQLVDATNVTWTFPTAFPNKCLTFKATNFADAAGQSIVTAGDMLVSVAGVPTTTSISLLGRNSGTPGTLGVFYVEAEGY